MKNLLATLSQEARRTRGSRSPLHKQETQERRHGPPRVPRNRRRVNPNGRCVSLRWPHGARPPSRSLRAVPYSGHAELPQESTRGGPARDAPGDGRPGSRAGPRPGIGRRARGDAPDAHGSRGKGPGDRQRSAGGRGGPPGPVDGGLAAARAGGVFAGGRRVRRSHPELGRRRGEDERDAGAGENRSSGLRSDAEPADARSPAGAVHQDLRHEALSSGDRPAGGAIELGARRRTESAGEEDVMAMTTSSLTITPVHPLFGAEIGGVDLARPLDDTTFARIAEAFDEYSVLVF